MFGQGDEYTEDDGRTMLSALNTGSCMWESKSEKHSMTNELPEFGNR